MQEANEPKDFRVKENIPPITENERIDIEKVLKSIGDERDDIDDIQGLTEQKKE